VMADDRPRWVLRGPLLDRIDIPVEEPRVDYEKLSDNRQGETSAAIRSRVEAARKRQRARFKDTQGVTCNAEMHPAEIRAYCELDAAGQSLIKAAMRQLHLSARAYHRILKLSRTIADLAGNERLEAAHLAEAVQYSAVKAQAGDVRRCRMALPSNGASQLLDSGATCAIEWEARRPGLLD